MTEVPLADLYDAGLYVVAGWHELRAYRKLIMTYPLNPNFTTRKMLVFVFPCMTDDILKNLRILAVTCNVITEQHQKMTWSDFLFYIRRQATELTKQWTEPQNKFTQTQKVSSHFFS